MRLGSAAEASSCSHTTPTCLPAGRQPFSAALRRDSLFALVCAAEIFGGAWMTFGAAAPLLGYKLPAALGPVVSDGALTLFLVTLAVTPANYYALTHGANFPLDVETPPKSHLIRLAFQAVLLAMLWEMAGTTLMDAKMNLGLL